MHTSFHHVQALSRAAPQHANHEFMARFREGKVYALLFSDGWIKVGRGRNPEDRILAHSSASSMRSATLVKTTVSGSLIDSTYAEAELIKFCSDRGRTVHGREWFVGVDYEQLVALIGTRFRGDSPASIEAARRAQSDRTEQTLSSVFGGHKKAAEPDPAEQKKWIESLAYARLLDRIFLDDGYSGWLFEPSDSGMSNFGNYASLVIHELPEDEVADLFVRAGRNPSEAIEQVTWAAREIIDAHVKSGGA
ncbi:hypothetical protein D3C76_312800 [compost metagenome]|jgi:hypothetical protein|uniref:GIY-YIG nuclease family protein n=1 Tax=Pseudomonas sp. NFX1 TaxID=2201355 RepID=UPI000F93D77E